MNNLTEILERNALEWGDDVALVEIDTPDNGKHRTWKEADLVESVPDRAYRKELTAVSTESIKSSAFYKAFYCTAVHISAVEPFTEIIK